MPRYRITLEPRTAFATPLKGDTLFGQLCWVLRHWQGEERLETLLDGYTQGHPFLVVSDALPHGYLPRPTLPAHHLGFDMSKADKRKAAKQLAWLPCEALAQPLNEWHRHLVASVNSGAASRMEEQSHNTLDRLTGTTGTGQFAPFSQAVSHYAPGARLDLYAVVDARLEMEEIEALLAHCGQSGFGKEASTGLGKFTVLGIEPLAENTAARHWLTLGPSVPASAALDPAESFYSVMTRFGKHGDVAVLTGQPFKNPVVMAQTGALFTLTEPAALQVLGHGLGGEGSLSRALPGTVHQGYAPVVPVNVTTSLTEEMA